MGKLARVATTSIEDRDFLTRSLQRVAWQAPRQSH
jgi:hypothetical protein